MSNPMYDDALPEPHAHREMMADLARRLAEQAIAIATQAAALNRASRPSEAWQALGRSQGYTEAAAQLLLVAKNL